MGYGEGEGEIEPDDDGAREEEGDSIESKFRDALSNTRNE